MGSFGKDQVAVVIVPFPAQGHLNQLQQLACIISNHEADIPVYYIGSSVHIRQAVERVNGFDIGKVRFQEIPTCAFASPPADPRRKFPAQLQPAWDATLSQREPVARFIRELSSRSRRVVVIHDPFMACVVQDVAAVPDAESYAFNCISAFADSSITLEMRGKEFPMDRLSKKIPSFEGCISDELLSLIDMQTEPLECRAGDIYNTCRFMEAPYLDILTEGERKTWAIGPILTAACKNQSPHHSPKNKPLFEWLDKQEPKSVIYVSFGTTISLSHEEIKELATGLEQSKRKFIWVLRDADKGDIFQQGTAEEARQLPQGFQERVNGIGLIIRDWAPQNEILGHPSTGGFMSHCGWNSCLESVANGVPIAAWPMHSDQPRNAYLVTEILKVGIALREWDQRSQVVSASAIADAVKRLMTSEDIRERAHKLGDAVRQATEKSGISRLEMDSFIAHITR